MNINKDVSLASYSTMRLGGKASYLVEVDTKDSLKEALDWAKVQNLPVLVIGGGSNIVWKDEGFNGLVIANKIHLLEFSEVEDGVIVSIGAGENWDEVVAQCCDKGLSGIECLSLIPGTAGATPIQNVGAYGQEISNVLVSVEAFDTETREFVSLEAKDCGFSYRHSRFKDEPGHFYITSLKLKLTKTSLQPPFYSSLSNYLNNHNISDYSPLSLRQAVISIRSAKLPDPKIINNCGSFFANPIISTAQFDQLQSQIEGQIPHWPTSDGNQKIAAAWLIENIGYKDYHDPTTGIGTWPSQSLVLVNESAKSTADLLAFKKQIVDKVKDKFDITLVQEPELLPLDVAG